VDGQGFILDRDRDFSLCHSNGYWALSLEVKWQEHETVYSLPSNAKVNVWNTTSTHSWYGVSLKMIILMMIILTVLTNELHGVWSFLRS